jgi:ankyrin repeat protein
MNSSFPKAALEEAVKLSELQSLLSDITEENFDETKEKVLLLPHLKNIEGIYQFVHELLDIFEIRVQSLPILAKLIKYITEQQNDDTKICEIKRVILKSAFRPFGKPLLHRKMEVLMFVRHCMLQGALKIDEIAQKIKCILNDCIFETAENSLLYFFFGGELETYDPPLFTLLSQKTNRHDNPLESFIDTLDLLCANGWEKMHELTENGCLKGTPIYACLIDDPKLLQNVDINEKYSNLFFQPRFIYERSPNILQIAAFYGAVNCFKFLSEKMNVARSEKYAVAGGNREIIEILKEKGCSMLKTIKIAARFRRYDIFEEIFKISNFVINDYEYAALNADEVTTIEAIFSKCARVNNVKSMLYSLENGANPTKWNVNEMIYIAAEEGHRGVLKLLASIPGIEAPGIIKGSTPLFAAAEGGHLGTLKALFKMKGADPSFRKGSRTMLHVAAYNGHQDVVEYLITSNHVDVNATDALKRTPLFFAIDGCYISVIKTFINAQGINLNAKDNDGLTPIHYAAKTAPSGIIAYLKDIEGFNFNEKDKQENTPFHYASCRETKSVAEQLSLAKGIDFTIKNKQGNTPLHLAAQTLSRVIEFVITVPGIDINAVNKEGQTPLHIAAKRNRAESTQVLVAQENIKLNVHDNKGMTPLLIAAKSGFIDVVKVLAKTPGIDPNDGNPLYEAAINGWIDVVIVLIEVPGINLSQPGPDGKNYIEVVPSPNDKAKIKEALIHFDRKK